MNNAAPISAALQNIALYGIRSDKLLPPKYGEWFHILLYLAWHAWNIANKGNFKLPPNFVEGIEEIKTNLEVTESDIAEYFISTDYHEIVAVMAARKNEEYPDDKRMIEAIELTESGNLKVYSI